MIGSAELSHLPETRASDEQGYIAEGRNILHGVCCRGLKTDKMSLENTKSAVNRHGFANAIFSSSPINFNKENRSPPERNKHVNHQELRFPTSAKSCKPNINSNLHSSTRKLNTDNITPVRGGLVRSSSATTLCRQNSLLPFKSSSEEKLRTPMKTASNPRLSADKTPVTHFCTPRRGSNPKMNVSTPARTPTKRYFNTSNVPPATPECFNSVHLETPRAKQDAGMEEQTLCEGETSNLTVGVRVRPLSLKELNDSRITPIVEVNGQNITVNCESSQHTFTYDHCFVSHADSSMPDHASQETVFKNMVLPLVDNAFEGYNACLFAYGQTGSGKSYSMMGTETGVSVLGPEAGIIPRFCHEIFSRAAKDTDVTTNVEISYFEIYNEKIHDLLVSNSGGGKRAPLKVREHPDIGPYVVDLSQHGVDSYEDLQAWLRVGNSQRVTAATGMNEKSSRSHSIFSVLLTRTRSEATSDRKNVEPSRKCKINLVDLAGSERLSHTCASGDRLREGVSINKSLLTLGKVIGSLAENTSNRKRGFVPYRESVLTWLLRESLGGNSRTAMLGTVSPANMHLEETLATLRYACQARAIVNRVRINEDPHDRTIRQLQAEVLRLRAMREGYERQLGVLPRRFFDCTEPGIESAEEIRIKEREIELLKEQLKRTEDQLAFTQKSWLEKLQDADKRRNTELRYLRRCGIALEIDLREKSTQPCLINLAADPILSGTLLYLIPPGLVRVGRRGTDGKTSREPDIVLDGPLVRQLHCTIENDDGKLVLSPNMEGETYINGQMVTDKVRLNHGDRLIIGGNHYFKVSNPLDNENNVQTAGQPVDFEFAHQEILKAQEEKLRAELEESKKRAMKELENAKHEVEMQLGSQKFTYEREIEALGLTLEQQKLALEEINRKKKELELEKEMLLSEVETNNRVRKIQSDESRMNIVPYCSNFLQDLEDILNVTTADAETALKMKISDEAMKSGGVSLHEMQLLVREATERCREVGINYEFDQQQVVAEKGLQPVIRVRDKDRRMETLWQPMRFLDWVHRLRDYDIEDSIKELRDSEDDWEAYEDTEVVEDSLANNSRISINMTPIKKQLNESLLQLSLDASFLDSTMADQTSESVRLQRNNDIAACLQQIVVATKTLGKLCHEYEDREISGMVAKSLDKVHDIMNGVRNILENRSACVSSNASGLGSTANEDTECTDIESRDVTGGKQKFSDWNSSSTKSTLRSTGSCPFVKNGNGQKSVRFDFK